MFILSTNQIINKINGYAINFNIQKNFPINLVVTNHKRVIGQNCVFVAIKGSSFDGHQFAKLAVENGAVFAIVETPVGNFPQIVVKNTRSALLQIAQLNRDNFNKPLVAITGSSGKTTIKDMTSLVLSITGPILKTYQNLNNEIGVAQTLLNLNSNYCAAVVELGMSHKNEIDELSKACKPNFAIISNVGTAHFENFKSIDDIVKAKLEIINGMKNDDPLIINFDDPNLKNLKLNNRPIIKCSIKNSDAHFFADKIEQLDDKIKFIAHTKNISVPVELHMIGIHNVLNALFCFAIGSLFKINELTIANQLAKFRTSGLRQKIYKINNIKIIADCYNASPQAMEAALITLSSLPHNGRKIAILGDMLELGSIAKSVHENLGILLNSLKIDVIVCYGQLMKNLKTNKPTHYFDNELDLQTFLNNSLKPNDCILFKASRAMHLENVVNYFLSKLDI